MLMECFEEYNNNNNNNSEVLLGAIIHPFTRCAQCMTEDCLIFKIINYIASGSCVCVSFKGHLTCVMGPTMLTYCIIVDLNGASVINILAEPIYFIKFFHST